MSLINSIHRNIRFSLIFAVMLPVAAQGASGTHSHFGGRSETSAPAAGSPGAFAIAQDQATVDALLREAASLRADFSEKGMRQSIEKYQEALRLWRAGRGEAKKEAEILLEAANTWAALHERYRNAADREKALETFDLSIRAFSDRKWESNVRREIGRNAARWRDLEFSLESYQRALEISRELDDARGAAVALTTIGQIHASLGRIEQARKAYDEALPFWREAKDRQGESVTLRSIALTYSLTGENRKALQLHLDSLKLRRELNDLPGQVNALSSVSQAYRELGEWQPAIEALDEAMKISRQINKAEDIAFTSLEIGVLYDLFGRPEKALEYFNQALPVFRNLNIRQFEALALNNIGKMHYLLGDRQQALDHHKQALTIFRAAQDPRGEIAALLNIARLTAEDGDYTAARDYVDQALNRAREIKSAPFEASALGRLGELSGMAGDREQALVQLRQSLQMSREMASPGAVAATLARIARVESDLGRLEDARRDIEAALDIIETLRSKLAAQELRTSYFARVQNYYEFYIDLLMRMAQQDEANRAGMWADALFASERSRARSLLDLLAESHADLQRDLDPALRDREQSAQQLLNRKVEEHLRLLNGPHSKAQADRSAKEIERLQEQYREVQTLIRQRDPRYAALTQPKPLSLNEIRQQVLDDETMLLSYALGEKRSYAWLVTRDSITGFELPKRETIEEASRRLIALITARNESRPGESAARRRSRIARADARTPGAAAALSRLVLRPALSRLNKQRLLIVADGALQYIPFAALRMASGAAPLITRHEIVMLPSASTLGVLRRETSGRAQTPRSIAVLADPVFDARDERLKNTSSTENQSQPPVNETRVLKHEYGNLQISRLPYTAVEADRILKLASDDSTLKAVGFAATRSAATDEELSQFRIVHFATHGYFDVERPELSGLVFSRFDQQGRPLDGLLLAGEIYGLRLSAELVVLSACETGLGKQVRGEGIVGLTRGFMYAGAPRVAISLWAINDRATADLMGNFYRELLRGNQSMSASAALRSAQLRLRRNPRWRAPYFWAPFTIQGEYKR
ncbi:MAG: CHAT domain-containing protein [Blastocatellales bacterium]